MLFIILLYDHKKLKLKLIIGDNFVKRCDSTKNFLIPETYCIQDIAKLGLNIPIPRTFTKDKQTNKQTNRSTTILERFAAKKLLIQYNFTQPNPSAPNMLKTGAHCKL